MQVYKNVRNGLDYVVKNGVVFVTDGSRVLISNFPIYMFIECIGIGRFTFSRIMSLEEYDRI